MRTSLSFNPIKIFQRKLVQQSQFEQNMTELIQRSKDALQELSVENFNSETLRTICMPDFKPLHPDCIMAISTKNPNKPIEVRYKRTQDDTIVSIDIFTNGDDKTILGEKKYILETDTNGKKIMRSGYMSSDEYACKNAGVKGIGMLERILQIDDAIKNGIKSIPCESFARSVLFHLKMGFLPVQQLKEINSLNAIDTIMKKLINNSIWDIAATNYTPIIILKNGKYYLDENTTQCIASLRQIKQNYREKRGNGVRPFIRGQCIDMELTGKNYDIWKQMLEKIF